MINLLEAIRNPPKPKLRKKSAKQGTHVKFFYRVVEQGSIPGIMIYRNGYIFALDRDQAADKLCSRWNLTGGATLERVDDELDGNRDVYNTCLIYTASKR